MTIDEMMTYWHEHKVFPTEVLYIIPGDLLVLDALVEECARRRMARDFPVPYHIQSRY